MNKIQEVVDLIQLEKKAELRFQGANYKAPWKRIFGGQVLAQSLYAAYQTVPKDRIAHSLHGYFLLTGELDKPITYEVDIMRDGGSFSTRRVRAIQNGKDIFIMAASFQLSLEGFDHQFEMPTVTPPEEVEGFYTQIEPLKKFDIGLHQQLSKTMPKAFEFRPIENVMKQLAGSQAPYRNLWFRSSSPIESDDLALHQELLLYASDYNLLTTASLPHNNSSDLNKIFFASLDHSLYLHRPFRIDEWLLYAIDSPSASNARGFARGNIFNQSGQLVASVIQEGLMQPWRK